MALQLSLSPQPWPTPNPISPSDPARFSARSSSRVELWASSKPNSNAVIGTSKMSSRVSVRVRSSLDTTVGTDAESDTLAGKVTEVNKDTFWPIVNDAGDKPVVVDMYTQWCGPCKVMAPKFKELAEQKLDVVFLKLDCNQENKTLAKELGIKVVPTFKILKNGKIVDEVTGAKYDKLVAAIEAALTG